MSNTDIRPTWGYHSDGRSEIFLLEGKDDLPKGWHDHPQKKTPRPEPDPAGVISPPPVIPPEARDGNSETDAVKARGIAARKEGKPRSVPPAYRGKDEEKRWLLGYDGQY